MAEQLHKAQTSLSLQNETARHAGRERKSLEEKVKNLKNNLQAAETESRALQVCLKRKKNIKAN